MSIGAVVGFDRLADTYDAADRGNAVRRWMRSEFMSLCLKSFQRGDTVLDIDCGTGEDALFLAQRGIRVVAVDASQRMIAVLERKIAAQGLGGLIEAKVLSHSRLNLLKGYRFDGALSDFGGMNYESDPASVSRELSVLLRPQAPFLMSAVSRYCAPEALSALRRGRLSQAFRRLRSQTRRCFPDGAQAEVYFRGAGEWRRLFAEGFEHRSSRGLGILVPPPAMIGFHQKHPRLIALLKAAESRIRSLAPFAFMGDFLVMEFRRR